MKKIGIIVAMDEEREAIIKIMTEVKIEPIYNLRFLSHYAGSAWCQYRRKPIGSRC